MLPLGLRTHAVCFFLLKKTVLEHVLTKEVNLRNAVLLRSVFLLAEVGLIDKCHLSYKQKLLGTEEYEYETHDTRTDMGQLVIVYYQLH